MLIVSASLTVQSNFTSVPAAVTTLGVAVNAVISGLAFVVGGHAVNTEASSTAQPDNIQFRI